MVMWINVDQTGRTWKQSSISTVLASIKHTDSTAQAWASAYQHNREAWGPPQIQHWTPCGLQSSCSPLGVQIFSHPPYSPSTLSCLLSYLHHRGRWYIMGPHLNTGQLQRPGTVEPGSQHSRVPQVCQPDPLFSGLTMKH